MYVGDTVGSIRETKACGACGPAVQARAKCDEFGAEWNYAGYGTCNACNFNCVNMGLGKACTIGTHAKCKKSSYLGDKTQCCLGLPPPEYPRKTCDPNYQITSGFCTDVLNNYCAVGNRIFTDNKCRSWAAAYPQQAFNLKKNYCTVDKIASSQACRDWVASAETQGKIDDLMVVNYCQTYDDPLCSCVRSEINCPNKFDGKCISQGGYKTYDMLTAACPNVMNCSTYVSLSPQAQAIATNVEQNCVSDSDSQKTNTPVADDTNYNLLWLVLIIMAIIIIGIVIGVVVYKKYAVADEPLIIDYEAQTM